MMKTSIYLISFFSLTVLLGCSASTGSRYEETKETKKTEEFKEKKREVDEDFDISPYKTEIKIEEEPEILGSYQPLADVWYGYGNSVNNNNGTKNVIGTSDGYRVQVLATDNIDEANQIRDAIYSKTNNKEVYVSFEPPFYKVKVGDFKSVEDASNLKFKLNQLGYSEARVIQDTINLFK